MYRITAIINKAGGAPVAWIHYSARLLTQAQCENMLSRDKEAGKGYGFRVELTEFNCEKVADHVRTGATTTWRSPCQGY